MTKRIKNKATTVASLQALINGAEKRFPNGSFTIGNTAFTTATLVKLLQSLIDAVSAVNVAEAQAKDAVATMRATMTQVAPVIQGFKRIVLVTFGNTSQTLVDFGMEPAKAPAPQTVEQKAATNAKREATRAARGTASPKQKAAVKGKVTGVTITPVVDAASATPAAAPPAPQSAPTTTAPSK